MKVPKDYLFREGDLVTVRARVRYDVEPGEPDVHLKITDAHTHVVVPIVDVLSLEGRTWKEGDRVLAPNNYLGEVLAVAQDKVWVKMDQTDDFLTIDSINLEPAPKTENPA